MGKWTINSRYWKIVNLSELFGVTTDYLLKSGEPSFELKNEDINDKDKLPVLSDELVKKYLTASRKMQSFVR